MFEVIKMNACRRNGFASTVYLLRCFASKNCLANSFVLGI